MLSAQSRFAQIWHDIPARSPQQIQLEEARDKPREKLLALHSALYAALEQLLRDIEPMEQAAGVRTASGDAARAALAMARGEGV